MPLLIVMKKSLFEGALPRDWKTAHVSSIYKKGPKDLAEITNQLVEHQYLAD